MSARADLMCTSLLFLFLLTFGIATAFFANPGRGHGLPMKSRLRLKRNAGHREPAPLWWSLARLIDPETRQLSQPISTADCDRLPLSKEQQALCHSSVGRRFMSVVARASLATQRECQRQFQDRRWNCATYSQGPLFGKVILKIGSREAAFIHALMSVSVAHESTEACRNGRLPNCACGSLAANERNPEAYTLDKDDESTADAVSKTESSFQWGSCHDNVKKGLEMSQRFVDATSPVNKTIWSEERILMNIHNHKAGRELLAKPVMRCKCHGLSGSCSQKVCVRSLPRFTQLGNILMERYKRASRMELGKLPGSPANILMLKDRQFTAPSQDDLVYVSDPPNYCEKKGKLQIQGTKGRRCNINSGDAGSCDVLCCDRGYEARHRIVEEQCQCKFVWCCEVKCHTCRKSVPEYFCK